MSFWVFFFLHFLLNFLFVCRKQFFLWRKKMDKKLWNNFLINQKMVKKIWEKSFIVKKRFFCEISFKEKLVDFNFFEEKSPLVKKVLLLLLKKFFFVKNNFFKEQNVVKNFFGEIFLWLKKFFGHDCHYCHSRHYIGR